MDISANSRRKAGAPARAFGIFVTLHVLVWTLLPVLLTYNLPLDTIEALSWGREWAAGYAKHPPMSGWLAELFRWGSADWPLWLLSQLAVGVAFWAVWEMMGDVLSPRAALVAAMALEGVHYYNLTSLEFNANVVQYPFWGLAALAFWRAVRRTEGAGLGWWALLGLACGGGLLGKYSFLLLPASMVLALVAVPALRSQWRGAGPWLALAIAATVFAPHVWWAQAHDFPTLRYATGRGEATDANPVLSRLGVLLSFTAAQAAALAPMLLLLWAAGGRPGLATADEGRPWRLPDRDRWMLLAMGGGPLAVYLVAGVVGVRLHDMWGSPVLLVAGPALAMAWGLQLRHPKRFARVFSGWALILVTLYGALAIGGPWLRGNLSRIHYPGRELAAAISQGWQQARGAGVPVPIVAGDMWAAGNVAAYLPPQPGGRPSVYIQVDPVAAQWLDDAKTRARGGVFVWEAPPGQLPGAPPADWLARFPALQVQPPLALDVRRFGRDFTVRAGWAILPPAAP